MVRFICFLMFSAFFSCNQPAAGAQSKLPPNAFDAMLQKKPNAQLIDVRTPEEYKSGYISGAVNLNIYGDNFAQQLAKLDKNKPVMVYCAKGGRSADAADQLKQAGFSEIYDLEGGMTAWIAAGKKTAQ